MALDSAPASVSEKASPLASGSSDCPATTLLLAARRHCWIAHHVPGRLRLRFDPLAMLGVLNGRVNDLEAVLGQVPGITRTELNLGASSLVIHYDAARLDAAAWERLVAGSEAAALAVLETVLPAA